MLPLSIMGGALFVVIYQDCKERSISTWTIPWILATALWYAFSHPFWEVWFLSFNWGFLAIQLLGLTLYFSLKEGKWINITRKYLGLGDILFFIAISPLFSPVQYVFFFIGSLIVTLLMVFLYNHLVRPIPTIPLAASFSCCTIAYMAFLYFLQLSSYNDWVFLVYFYG